MWWKCYISYNCRSEGAMITQFFSLSEQSKHSTFFTTKICVGIWLLTVPWFSSVEERVGIMLLEESPKFYFCVKIPLFNMQILPNLQPWLPMLQLSCLHSELLETFVLTSKARCSSSGFSCYFHMKEPSQSSRDLSKPEIIYHFGSWLETTSWLLLFHLYECH